MSDTLNILIVGATGKMGQALIQEIVSDKLTKLCGAIEHKDSSFIGHDAGHFFGTKTNIDIKAGFDDSATVADVLIDFTRPSASLEYLAYCRNHKIKYVLGTTGFLDKEKEIIEEASNDIAICFAPNMSVGVNLLLSLVETATKVLHEDFDIEIIETHHKDKVDAPSGTALGLGEAVALCSNRTLAEHGIFQREGVMAPRQRSDIGFSTIRGGDVVGDHTVLYAGDGERIELTHKAGSRKTFAKGALRAAKFIATKSHGLFDMRDVLNLKS